LAARKAEFMPGRGFHDLDGRASTRRLIFHLSTLRQIDRNLFGCFQRVIHLVKIQIRFPALFRLVFFTAAVCALSVSDADAGLAGSAATEVTVSEYSSKNLSLIAQVHAACVFVDYEHWGFFRIGLLPMLVAENVQVKIQSAECLTNALADLRSWHQPASGYRQLELRNLEITMNGENQPRLRAAVARVGPDGTVKLSTVAVRTAAGQEVSLLKATLQIFGPSAGRLCWNSGGHQEERFILHATTDKTP
jgi:hypothetical protein